jgi:AraC-like DNA-binding protein
MVVKSELERMQIPYLTVNIGEANLPAQLKDDQKEKLNLALKKMGLELLDDKKSILVERIKHSIIELVHYTEDQIKVNLSDHLRERLGYDYTYLANLFSEVKGVTIEQFFIIHRIERAKELLVYGENNLNEIAYMLHFSSSAHLCKQFKKVTGLTPSHFKKLKHKKRDTLENV